MSSTRSLKHRAVSAVAEDLLAHSCPGERIPGIREIMVLSGSGRPSVERELHRLVREGRLRAVPRLGFFRTGERPDPRKVVLLHGGRYPAEENSFTDRLFDSLRRIGEKEDFFLSIVGLENDTAESFSRLAENLGTEKLFLFGCASRELAARAHAAFRYCLELLPRHDAFLGSEIRDSPEMTVIQLEYLFRHNCRKIGYFHHVEPEHSRTPVEYHRLFDYYRIMAEEGIRVHPSWVLYAPWEWGEFEKSMEKFFSSGNLPEVVIMPGSSLHFFYRFCRNRGIEIGRDIGVMGCDSLAPDLKPPVTTITNDPVVIAEEAWKAMKQCLAGEEVRRTTRLTLLTGSTVEAISKVWKRDQKVSFEV